MRRLAGCVSFARRCHGPSIKASIKDTSLELFIDLQAGYSPTPETENINLCCVRKEAGELSAVNSKH